MNQITKLSYGKKTKHCGKYIMYQGLNSIYRIYTMLFQATDYLCLCQYVDSQYPPCSAEWLINPWHQTTTTKWKSPRKHWSDRLLANI